MGRFRIQGEAEPLSLQPASSHAAEPSLYVLSGRVGTPDAGRRAAGAVVLHSSHHAEAEIRVVC
jgi:hypothetical protein